MSSWYVLHCLTGKEIDVCETIKGDAINALVPRRLLMERNQGKWHEILRTLYPGYVFVNTKMNEENYYKLSEVPGVIKILRGANDYPIPVPEEEMQVVLSLTQNDDKMGISDVIIEGDSVRVIDGVLKGFEGLIVKIEPRRFRAKVKFSLMGQERYIDLGINVLAKEHSLHFLTADSSQIRNISANRGISLSHIIKDVDGEARPN